LGIGLEWDSDVCHKGTVLVPVLLLTLVLTGTVPASAQTGTDWRKVGSSSFDLRLAGPASGPVARVWFSEDGSVLYAQTGAGATLRLTDAETWEPVTGVTAPPAPSPASAVRTPENNMRVVAASNSRTLYGLGGHLYRSEDGGRAWDNLTAYRSQSVIGPGINDVTSTPSNPNELVVANDFGVWRTMDGGLTWTGLNQFLPNLSMSRILSTPANSSGTRVQMAGNVLELPPGGSVWRLTSSAGLQEEEALLQRYSKMIGSPVKTVARADKTVYAGLANGRIWKSFNDEPFVDVTPTEGTSGAVERIWVDPSYPEVALAALSGSGPHVLRTVSGGQYWDVLDNNLPNAAAYGIAGDRAAGAVYVATEKGVFSASVGLQDNSVPTANWVSLSSNKLPAGRANDVRLDPAGVQLYAAIDAYGVYATPAPHRTRYPQIVNTADYSTRAAAPGSLVSLVGARITTARGGSLSYPVFPNLFAGDVEESQIQVPFEAVGPNVALNLRTAAGTFNRDLTVQPVSPAILVYRDGLPAIYDADSDMPLDGGNVSHANARIKIMATGLGKVKPEWHTGMAAPLENPPEVVAPVRAFLDNSAVQVTRATLAPGHIGWYIIEVQLPSIANYGAMDLYVTADGQESNHVQIVIEP
jgi:uncharacterized protein (TIGR03437 family)